MEAMLLLKTAFCNITVVPAACDQPPPLVCAVLPSKTLSATEMVGTMFCTS